MTAGERLTVTLTIALVLLTIFLGLLGIFGWRVALLLVLGFLVVSFAGLYLFVRYVMERIE